MQGCAPSLFLFCMCDLSSSLIWFQVVREAASFFFFLNLICFQKESLSGFHSLTSVDSNSSAGVSHFFCLSSPKSCIKKAYSGLKIVPCEWPTQRSQRRGNLSHSCVASAAACVTSSMFMNILLVIEAMHQRVLLPSPTSSNVWKIALLHVGFLGGFLFLMHALL